MIRAWFLPMFIALILAVVVAAIGMTVTSIGPWYHSLVLPYWAPPDAMYGVAWTSVYAITALAGVTGWLATPQGREQEWQLGMFALSGLLNIAWSYLFFQFHRPDLALVEVVALWLSAVALIVMIWRRSMVGAVLLLPYLFWVTYAGYLTMTIVRLNAPFS